MVGRLHISNPAVAATMGHIAGKCGFRVNILVIHCIMYGGFFLLKRGKYATFVKDKIGLMPFF